MPQSSPFSSLPFVARHVGPRTADIERMLGELGLSTLEQLVERCVPRSILVERPPQLPEALSEPAQVELLRSISEQNEVRRSFIGMGYYPCFTPSVITRNILENPGWYTQYTPYQAEIAQGRLEALMNYQTLISDLTGLRYANASLLDEGTAAAEAVTMCHHVSRKRRNLFFACADTHPQTLAVLKTRCEAAGITLQVGELSDLPDSADLFGVLVSYPASSGVARPLGELSTKLRQRQVNLVVCTDLLALTLLEPPGECGADIVVGSSQRLGVPMGYGGPHAAFIATREEHKRLLPGRIVGLSIDAQDKPAYRLALQTREQHIRRDRATSNICTAQVLLAIVASMYAVYHGPEGLTAIARRIHDATERLRTGLKARQLNVLDGPVFDTLTVVLSAEQRNAVLERADALRVNLRRDIEGQLSVSLDEPTSEQDLQLLMEVFTGDPKATLPQAAEESIPPSLRRSSSFLTHPVFRQYQSEHELLRYMKRLEERDLSLTTSMIPLGSCTMKLNATSEMLALTWPAFAELHPFAPASQAAGYRALFKDLEEMLAELTGMTAVSLQPNAGAQGEYAGLLTIRAYHAERGDAERCVCLIPASAHGTNPATAVMAGMQVVTVSCNERGDIDVEDLRSKAEQHAPRLAAMMLTYPSTHGVFEESVREICEIVRQHGGLVYLDGANLNAQVGLCRPGDYGADVCHLNLHKTFCIPHGGGGPGMGPIAVNDKLARFLPGHPLDPECGGENAIGPVSAAPYGSPSILTIPWAYIRMMGTDGLRKATQVAILAANYMAQRLEPHYGVLYRGAQGGVAHEFILDLRPYKKSAGIEVDDVAKRLMDYGFHSPTMSFPVAGTLMIEPTESESLAELDRLCTAMILIREEIRAIEEGRIDRLDNPLKNAPHPAHVLLTTSWEHPYSREEAAYPAPWSREHKYWPPVSRVDNARGDRQLVARHAGESGPLS